MQLVLLHWLCLGLVARCAEIPVSSTTRTLECEFYDPACADQGGTDCHGTKKCHEQPGADRSVEEFCFTVWQNGTADADQPFQIKRQGCVANHGGSQDHCRNNTECVEENSGMKEHMFCCCSGNSCNKEFRWEPVIVEPTGAPAVPAPPPSPQFYLLIYSAVPVLVLLVIGLAVAYIYRQRKSSQFSSLSQSEDGPVSPPTPTIIHRPVELLEIKARGRFGAVWKGNLSGEKVAIKIFPLQDKQSWFAEQEIYNLPQMTHDNVLHFIGVDRRGENLQQEFWLVTAFHDHGSLCDFLKGNTVTIEDLIKISLGIATGLTHLHTEIPSSRGSGVKPAIAHRDFKSKNVLIRADKTACIGDFGLALQFKPNEIVGDTHGQVGTRRYMAPEVLEGAINFSRDAFLRIDMYACGLVLWEVLTRCRDLGPVHQYKMPFEAEASPHPTLEEISDLVVTRKIRPEFRETWKKHDALSILCETIEECWDHDAEARLSSSCVQERLGLVKSVHQASSNNQEENRLLCEENLNNALNTQLSLQQRSAPTGPHIIMQQLNSNADSSH